MESQLGLMNVWNQGDWVIRSVAVLLLGMSLWSWIVIVLKELDILRFKKFAQARSWRQITPSVSATRIGTQDNMVCRFSMASVQC